MQQPCSMIMDMPATKFELDESKLSALYKVRLSSASMNRRRLYRGRDRMNTDLGNEFNNSSVAIANGDEPQSILDKLQQYAEDNQK